MSYSIKSQLQRRPVQLFGLSVLVGLLLPLLIGAGPAPSSQKQHSGGLSPIAINIGKMGAAAPTDAQCRAKLGVPCYSPQEIRNAYDVTPLIKAGYTGKGQTIVIIDSYGSPTLVSDLKTFDKGYGLPDPPSVKQLAPLGSVPFNPNDGTQVGWADETSLDVQWSHAMAPDASIVVLTSPVAETQGVPGMPEFYSLEQYALNHHLGKIISQSWGTTENTLFSKSTRFVLNEFEQLYQRAANEHVSVFASAGDSGVSNPDVNGNNYPFPTVGFPASSPLVTAVGGTSLYATPSGKYQYETVWNDNPKRDIATGGGVSRYFKEPDYQKHNLPASVQKELKGHRGLPDISYNADPYTSIPVYLGFMGGSSNGYSLFGGTSEGSPQWAGITADANQYAHHPLGFLNPMLYSIGSHPSLAKEVYHDITVGNNATGGLPGYSATPGWDLATGWGTPKAAALAQVLAYYSR